MLFQKYVRGGSLTSFLNSRQLRTARAAHKRERSLPKKTNAEESDHRWIPGITTFKIEQTFSMIFQKYVRDGSLTRLLNSRQLRTSRAAHKLQGGLEKKTNAEESDQRWIPGITTFKIEKTFSMIFQKYVGGGAVLLRFWIHVSFVQQEQLTNFKVASERRRVQRSRTIAEYRE